MASTNLTFSSRAAHREWLATQAVLPRGFRAGTTRFEFTPAEVGKKAAMNLTLLALDRPTADFAAVFTRNAFPGAPVLVGRRRLAEPTLGAVVVNTKISNVRAPDGENTAERLCAAVAGALGMAPGQVLPSSTGIIGWRIPIEAMLAAVPAAVAALAGGSLLDAASGIVTTDLYPKARRATVGQGSIVGIAKGAGMIEPNMATMLVYLLSDLAMPRAALRRLLPTAVDGSFNCISVDSDTSTSDTVVLLSSGAVPCADEAAFARALATVCGDLAEDVVRNGEGVHHVLRVAVNGAPSEPFARGLGKSVINSPLCKTATAGNDANVGRILAAIGKYLGVHAPDLDTSGTRIMLGGKIVFEKGSFQLSPETEAEVAAHLKQAEVYASRAPQDGVFRPPIDYPPHERCVELAIDLASGPASATVLGADLTHEYISENADYRS
ncbi:MAG: bifunctional ornithine acetyltransferase/N-acetylglutamate synthase [Deltaproteobacteria bacterium]|nr:bifunctional ornithine acetyltransferase/N-acetylglutamate synthase [Deltaproteobacteria bacterium]